MTVTETRAAYEAAIIEAMHTQAAPVAPEPPDLEYTPITAPLPRLVRREELDAARSERDSLGIECALLRAERDQLRGIRDSLEAERDAAQAVLRVITACARVDLTSCVEVLRRAADVLRDCDCPVTATIVDEHAAHIAARWEVQS